jgi:hypothetical protein
MITRHITDCIPDELRERGDVGGLVPHDPGLVQRARVSLLGMIAICLTLHAAVLCSRAITGGSAGVQLAASGNSAMA